MLQANENTYPFVIKSYHSDVHNELTLQQLFLYFQECAWANAQANGFGYDFVEENQALWVLNRVLLKIQKYPKWEEEIYIRTWPSGHETMQAYRDFQVKIGEDVVGQVISSWLVLDKKTRRPRKIDELGFSNNNYLNERALSQNPDKIIFPEKSNFIVARKVHYSDIDVNGHVNNATYVRWATDVIFQNIKKKVIEFEINYLRELHLNDVFVVFKSEDDQNTYVELKNNAAKTICVVRVKFDAE